jgi:hypothetical protein
VTSSELPKSEAGPIPVAEFQAPAVAGNIEYESFPIKKPIEDLDDFKVQVRASTLRRVRSKLQGVKAPGFPWQELALGMCTLAFGGSLGALPAKLSACDSLAIFFYTVLPCIGTGCLVAYLFLRHSVHHNPVNSAGEALAELPDPDKAR